MSERRSELKAVAGNEIDPTKAGERDFAKMTVVMMEGWTEMNSRLAALAQDSLRINLNAAEELRQCQSPRDLMDCQLRLARESVDGYMDGARQISDLMVKLSTDAMGCLGLPRM